MNDFDVWWCEQSRDLAQEVQSRNWMSSVINVVQGTLVQPDGRFRCAPQHHMHELHTLTVPRILPSAAPDLSNIPFESSTQLELSRHLNFFLSAQLQLAGASHFCLGIRVQEGEAVGRGL